MRHATLLLGCLGAMTARAAEPTRVVWCAAAADCGAHPLGRDGAAAWAERRDREIAAAATVIFWSRGDYDRFTDGRTAPAAALRQRAAAADPIVDGWRWLGAQQRRLVLAAAGSRAALERALAAAAMFASEHELAALVEAEARAAAELRALAVVRADLAVEARAEAERHQAQARALAPPPRAPLQRVVEHVWFVRGAAAPARLPNGERGPLRFRDGAVWALADPPPGAALVYLDPQSFSDARDALAPARLADELAARLAHGVPATEARGYLDERLLVPALVRQSLLGSAAAPARPLLRAQLDDDLARLQQTARRHGGDLPALAAEAAATAALLARLAAHAGRDSLAQTLESLRAADEQLR